MEQVLPKVTRSNGASLKQTFDPEPRETAETDFQTARPINSNRIGVLFMPVVPLAEHFLGVSFFMSQAITFGKRNEMLMTIQLPDTLVVASPAEIQLPDDFGISNFGEIKILDLEPWLPRGTFTVNNVQVPIDLWTVVQLLISEQIELMFANRFGAPYCLLCLLWQTLPPYLIQRW